MSPTLRKLQAALKIETLSFIVYLLVPRLSISMMNDIKKTIEKKSTTLKKIYNDVDGGTLFQLKLYYIYYKDLGACLAN